MNDENVGIKVYLYNNSTTILTIIHYIIQNNLKNISSYTNKEFTNGELNGSHQHHRSRYDLKSWAIPFANCSLESTPLTPLFASLTITRYRNNRITRYRLGIWRIVGILTSISAQSFFFRYYFVRLTWVSSCQSTQ